jgi:hypothetical protein
MRRADISICQETFFDWDLWVWLPVLRLQGLCCPGQAEAWVWDPSARILHAASWTCPNSRLRPGLWLNLLCVRRDPFFCLSWPPVEMPAEGFQIRTERGQISITSELHCQLWRTTLLLFASLECPVGPVLYLSPLDVSRETAATYCAQWRVTHC